MTWLDRNKHNPFVILVAAFILAMALEVSCPSFTNTLHQYDRMED